MNSLTDVPPDGGAVSLDPLTATEVWNSATASTQAGSLNGGNSTQLLYIAVEYVKPGYKLENDINISTAPQTPFSTYESHVSPLDPNMSSVARYSPVYTETPPTPFNNPVIVHQLVPNPENPQQQQQQQQRQQQTDAFAENSVGTLDGNRFLHMMASAELPSADAPPTDGLQLVPDTEQEVELLITDQATGISYSVSTQELLVGRCLDDEQQLLDALVPGGPLLDAELLSLADNTLKAQLLENVEQAMGALPVLQQNGDLFRTGVKMERDEEEFLKGDAVRRSKRQMESAENEELMQRIYSISDKPFLSRARATLPEAYLVINKQNEEYGVFARKFIPKRTQFGPLEGKIILAGSVKSEECALNFFIEDLNGSVTALDTSDENCANWMRFVRKAKVYGEVNLLLSQQGNHLFYITTKNILPKQELLVDYSAAYAEKHNLIALKPNYEEENPWRCFECPQRFPTSEEMQKHLNLHDDVKSENVRPKKKHMRIRKKVVVKSCVRKQFQEYGSDGNGIVKEKHLNNCFKCDDCKITFPTQDLHEIHQLQHNPDYNPHQETPTHICPACQHKCTTQKQLLAHILQHTIKQKPSTTTPTPTSSSSSNSDPCKGYKCTACYKIFATRERILKHMLVHGSEESKPLQCVTCKKRFLNNSALACHLKTHFIGKKVFECPICKESFDHVLQLKSHVGLHCNNGEYTCPHCGKVFKKYSIVRKHIRAFHCERVHCCSDCGKAFPTLDKLRMHLLRHSDHREFLCADCGKQFKRKDKLREHCKRMHSEEGGENTAPNRNPKVSVQQNNPRKFTPKVQPTDYHRFIYKCHACMVGFKRRGMLVNHLAKRHPDISPDSVPELNLPILRTTRDYYCQYCDRVYKSSSKRKAHILKHHPGAALPVSNRRQGGYAAEVGGLPNPTYSQTVGSVAQHPQNCRWCHKQYASKAKLLQHQRKKHRDLLEGVEVGRGLEEGGVGDVVGEQQQQQQVGEEQFRRDFRVSDEELISEMIELNTDKEGTYYQMVSVPPTDTTFNEINNSDSRLYRLLTTSSAIPPR